MSHALLSRVQVRAVVRRPKRTEWPVAGFCAPRRHEHAVADGADGLARAERVDRHPLHLHAFEVVAHAPGPVTSREHQGVVIGPARFGPVEGRAERSIPDQRVVGRPGAAVSPQDATDHRGAAQDRHHAPRIEPLPGDHEVVGLARPPRRGGESHVVPRPRQDLPRHGDLCRVEVAGGDWDEHDRHGCPARLPTGAKGLAAGAHPHRNAGLATQRRPRRDATAVPPASVTGRTLGLVTVD